MKAHNRSSAFLFLTSALVLSAACHGCSVDFEDFVYDDDEFAKKEAEGGAAGDGDGDGTTGDTGNEAFCKDFCDDSATICEFGTELGYKDKDECSTACLSFTVDQLECRIFRLSSAENDPDQHCPSTLLDGGGVCPDATPDRCEAFCEGSVGTCPFGSERGYADEDECLTTCATFNEEQLDCRETHLGFAQQASPETHCLHTLLDGGGVCPDATPDLCEAFCVESAAICDFGSELGYADEADCLAGCALFSDDDLKCRQTHLNFAIKDAKGHCSHTLLDGDGVCDPVTE